MTNVESLAKLKELLDNGAISQEEFDEQKKSILLEETQKRKKKNIGLIISVVTVIVICIGIIFGNNPKLSEEDNSATETQEIFVPSEFKEECPVYVTASIYDNIIGVPELKCNFKNLKEKEIAAIKLYFEPRDVYGESINSIFITNELQTDETIATALVLPHMIMFITGAVFGWIGLLAKKAWGALVAAILYAVGTFLFLAYAMFGVPILILGFVGYAKQKKLNKTE